MRSFQLDLAQCWFLQDQDTCFILDILAQYKGSAYVVGGAVRNILFGIGSDFDDIDITTDLLPNQLQDIAREHNIKSIETAIEYGTVTWVVGKRSFEITTFRDDVETDGRRAVVRFSQSLEEDAVRRDFTVNALYCDRKGQVYCPVTEHRDVEEKQIKFIGEVSQRIREDYLRILRYFRFASLYGIPDDFDLICSEIKNIIEHDFKRPAAERNFSEFKKLAKGAYFQDVLYMLLQHDFSKDFFNCSIQISREQIVELFNITKNNNIYFPEYIWIAFLFNQDDIFENEKYFCFSRQEKRHIQKIYALCYNFQNAQDVYEIIVKQYGTDEFLFHAALLRFRVINGNIDIVDLLNMEVPEYNISAAQLIQGGIDPKEVKKRIEAIRIEKLRLHFPNL